MTASITLRVLALCALSGSAAVVSGHPQAELKPGLIITRSVKVRPGTFRIASRVLEQPAITIRGENITVDFNGAVLAGRPEAADPDTYTGVGVLIDGGSNVTVKNAVIRGYKIGILARNSPNLHLTGNDVSYNWKQRLYSGIEKESLVDWMSYHQNERDEWLRYGAGMYLHSCDRAQVDHNTAVQGQNGLMVTHSDRLKIWNNTLQFLSAIGVGLYRVTGSTIMHNRIDWCVRGYSHGFYNRGQDSAGLLMYEQSSNNTVAYNSVTHGGDGLFLWAGQSTMDTGRGGSNDNLFYGNDFSHAPTNGIEATFSRNRFINNHVEENWHGVWGGYSYESLWQGNRFIRNTEGIAIEHGQDNVIVANSFESNDIAVRLWQNPTQDPNWGYPKNRDTRSRGYRIHENTFRGNKKDLDIKNTIDVEQGAAGGTGKVPVDAPKRLDKGMDPMIPPGGRRGRQTIIVDEWGPYDWKSPKLWPEGRSDQTPLRLRVLGPTGTWKLKSARGASVSPTSGRTGTEITVTPRTRGVVDFDVQLEYRGRAVTSPRGGRFKAGAPYGFGFSRFSVPAEWAVRFFEYTDAQDPVKQPAAFEKLLLGTPIKTVKVGRLDYISGRSIEDGVPRDRVAFTAEARLNLPPGTYTLQVISDDGVRVWADGKLVLDAWDPHESRVDRVPLTGGVRTLKVHYFEADGWAEMRLDIQPHRKTK